MLCASAAAAAAPGTRRHKMSLQLSPRPADIDLGAAIDEVEASVDPVVFLRDYVGPNKPLIIRGGCAHWPALHKWTRAYLADLAGGLQVSVDVTPNGAVLDGGGGGGGGGSRPGGLPLHPPHPAAHPSSTHHLPQVVGMQ